MKKEIDELLKQALTPTEEPDFWLNQKILNQVKEEKRMNIRKAGKIQAAMLAAALVIGAGSISAYAAWKYLAPEKISESLHDGKLTNAFQSEDAMIINETQSYGGYRVTLLGIISGKDITDYEHSSNDQVRNDRSYIAVAIENADGTPFPERADEFPEDLQFMVSPFIRGYDPAWYNVMTMSGGYSEFVENGILYRLVDCDNVEIFADHGLYLGIIDDTFYNNEAYHYDKKSGKITRNEDYKGLNALFDLPIDPSKADPKAAANYITSLENSESNEADDADDSGQTQNSEQSASEKETEAWMEQITPENIDQYAKCVKSSVQILTPDKDGYIFYKYKVNGRSSGSGEILASEYFQDGKKKVITGYDSSGDGLDDVVIHLFTLNDDGTVTYAAYIPKEEK